ncbi:MAG: ABC transporter permease subunit, partial [Sporichthyaceae bacterium]|nr:ABC transporter permease subunit [Sporichthyaceae bacterium]
MSATAATGQERAAQDGALVVTAGWRRVLGRLLRQPVTLACLTFLLLLALVAVLAPLLAPYPPDALDVRARLRGPSAAHWLGTDELGRDVLSRMLFATRVALRASFQSVSLALLVGVPLGLLVGYAGGWWDRVVMRGVELLQSIPALLLAFAIVAVLGRGLTTAMLAVSIVFVANYMRITRTVVRAERERLYVDAAIVLGLS